MGLFSFIKGQFIDVIEWVDASRDTVVWKFPDQDKEVKMGAQLTVRESQAAILINEGAIADIFKAGRHELTTRNMPIMTSLRSWKHGFESPFKVDVYFVNLRQFTDLKWGTPTPVYIPDAKFGQVEIRAFGAYNFRVADPGKFYKEFAGTDPIVELRELEGTLRGKIVDRFTEVVAEMAGTGLSFVQFQANKSEFAAGLLPRIKDYFEQFGLEITDFQIQSITLPDEVNAFLRKNTQMNMVGDLQKFQQFQQATAMEEAAKNGGNMSQPGMDMASMMMANMMMQNMQNQQNNNAPAKKEEEGGDLDKKLDKVEALFKNGKISSEQYEKMKQQILDKFLED